LASFTESPVKHNHSQDGARHPTTNYVGPKRLTYSVLLVLTRWRHYLTLATPYWLDVTDFPYPLSFIALVWGDPLRIHGKALKFLKLESSMQPTVKIWWS